MGGFKALIKDFITCADGESGDIIRMLLFVGGLAFVAFAGYSVWKTGVFDPQNYGLGFGGLLAGAGGGIGMKANSEPKGE